MTADNVGKHFYQQKQNIERESKGGTTWRQFKFVDRVERTRAPRTSRFLRDKIAFLISRIAYNSRDKLSGTQVSSLRPEETRNARGAAECLRVCNLFCNLHQESYGG